MGPNIYIIGLYGVGMCWGCLGVSGGCCQTFVDMLMVGRVALLYQTTDGLVSGAYNKDTREFEIVDQGTYQRSINTAIRMANAKAPQNTLLLLPIAAPSQGSVQ